MVVDGTGWGRVVTVRQESFMRPVVRGGVALVAVLLSGAPAADGGGAPARAPRAPAELRRTGGFFGAAARRLPSPSTDGSPPAPRSPGRPPEAHEFFFTRAVYSDWRGRGGGLGAWNGRGGGRGSWATDYPKADRQFLVVAKRLANLDAYDYENAVSLADAELRRYPFLYALEVGNMRLTESEAQGLRDYIAAGGFLVIDDFWGTREWANFEAEIARVLPGRPLVDLPLDHPLFSTFYNIERILQVPSVNNIVYRGITYERDGYVPQVKGIFDDTGRLVVVVNFNTDLGDAWEWAENPYYPLEYSTFAYEMGVNMIIYAMSH